MSEVSVPQEFNWSALVPRVIHPMRVSIIEALRYVGRPLSANEVSKLLGGEFSVSFVSYHMKSLAELGAVKQVRWRQVRGAQEKFFAIPDKMLWD